MSTALLALAILAARGAVINVTAVADPGPYFALTFDAHERTEGAKELLSLLRERRIRATLFVTGRFAERNPDILRLAVAAGHEIGNHTYSHPHLTKWAATHRHETLPGMTRQRLQDELRRTAIAIATATGRQPAPLWRAPYGEHNAEIRAWAAELGLLHVDWTRAEGSSLDALDWVEDPHARNFLSAEAIARRLIRFEERTGVPLAGSIILMHLGSGRANPPLLEALPIFLDETDRRGLRPIPVGELLAREGQAAPPKTDR